MEEYWLRLKNRANLANNIESHSFTEDIEDSIVTTLNNCRKRRKVQLDNIVSVDLSDSNLFRLAHFTDSLQLSKYERLLHIVPRLVNVVTLAEGLPIPGSQLKLPLDLKAIASACTNSYFAPKRFAAVQLAFANPRCRVLVFRKLQILKHKTRINPQCY